MLTQHSLGWKYSVCKLGVPVISAYFSDGMKKNPTSVAYRQNLLCMHGV